MLYAWFRSKKYTNRFRAYLTLELALENRPRSNFAVLRSLEIHAVPDGEKRCPIVPNDGLTSSWRATGRIRPGWIDIRADTPIPEDLATYLEY